MKNEAIVKGYYSSSTGFWADDILDLLVKLEVVHRAKFVAIAKNSEMVFLDDSHGRALLEAMNQDAEWYVAPVAAFETVFASKLNMFWLTMHLFEEYPALKPCHREDPTPFESNKTRQNHKALCEVYVWDATELLVVTHAGPQFPKTCGRLGRTKLETW